MIISREDKVKLLKQTSCVFWFTGLSGAGKSTLAQEVEKVLYNKGYLTALIDGDEIRKTLNTDLGFSDSDRHENNRRVAHIAKLLYDTGVIVLVSTISPFQKDRDFVQDLIGSDNFYEIYVSTPLEICQKRDVKGLYKKVKTKKLKQFTGITSSYEPPIKPSLRLDTSIRSQQECISEILALYLNSQK